MITTRDKRRKLSLRKQHTPSIFDPGRDVKDVDPEALRRYRGYLDMGYYCLREDIGWLYPPAHPRGLLDHLLSPPGNDHWFLFARRCDNAAAFYLSQPYGCDEKEIHDWAEQHELSVSIDPAWSFWLPGRTSGILYYRDERLIPARFP